MLSVRSECFFVLFQYEKKIYYKEHYLSSGGV